MTGSACGTDVIDVFRNDEKKEIARCQRNENTPPLKICEAFRHNRERRRAEEGTGSKADECAKPLVRARQRRSERPTDNGEEKRTDHITNRQTHFSGRSVDQKRRELKSLFLDGKRQKHAGLFPLLVEQFCENQGNDQDASPARLAFRESSAQTSLGR
jgi:hypothetical protein